VFLGDTAHDRVCACGGSGLRSRGVEPACGARGRGRGARTARATPGAARARV